jgi:hypothetical protein
MDEIGEQERPASGQHESAKSVSGSRVVIARRPPTNASLIWNRNSADVTPLLSGGAGWHAQFAKGLPDNS